VNQTHPLQAAIDAACSLAGERRLHSGGLLSTLQHPILCVRSNVIPRNEKRTNRSGETFLGSVYSGPVLWLPAETDNRD